MDRLSGISQSLLFKKLLDCIDNGVSTQELRNDPMKYLVSGEMKTIVINTGGEGLKVSYQMFQEMSKRGDELATKILKEDNFYVIDDYTCQSRKFEEKDATYYDSRHKQWNYLGTKRWFYDRENKVLIQMLREKAFKSIGGWSLRTVQVPVEKWAYRVRKLDDWWGSEYIAGYCDIYTDNDSDEESKEDVTEPTPQMEDWKKGTKKVNQSEMKPKAEVVTNNRFSLLQEE
jgi:hypothetical protein